MIPRLVPEISPLDAFCDVVVVAGVVVVVGNGEKASCAAYCFSYVLIKFQKLSATLKETFRVKFPSPIFILWSL